MLPELKLAVIVLHYRNLDDTLECLESLERQDYAHFEVILIDNGSSDPLEEAVKKFPRLLLLRNEANLGYAEGNNCGIRFALQRGAEALLLLNNDTTTAPDLLSAFAKAARDYPEAGVFGAKIYFYDEPTLIWHAGGNVCLKTYRCYHEGCLDWDTNNEWKTVRDINYACGCAVFIRAEAIGEVGLMAPEFFLIWEEIDWCWRLRKAGFRCLYIPQARVWHKISHSFEGGKHGPLWKYYFFRNRLLFLKRHFSLSKRLRFYFGPFFKEVLQILYASLRANAEERKNNRSSLKGVVDYFLHY